MGKKYDILANGTAAAHRDAAWRADVRLEIVRAVAERERHSLSANLIGWAVCAAAALALPYGAALILPLTLRLLAIGSTRMVANRLRANLLLGRSPESDLRWVTASLGLAGVSWALLLWPIMHRPPVFEAGEASSFAPAIAIIGVAIVAVSLIASMLGPLPRVMASFLACFMATLAAGAAMTPDTVSPWAITAVVGMIGGMVAFSLGTARDNRGVAEALVDNRRLGEELAEALARAEFLSLRDPLTGLLNRRAFFESDDRPQGASHVLAIDLDHFKRINDRFGHAVGDRVLVAVAEVLRDVARALPGAGHLEVRLGGEEFALQLAGIDHAMALATAEVLRTRIGEVAERLEQPGLEVSASIGVAPCPSPEALDAALNRADEALYRAKAAGRDRVMAAAA